MPSPVTWGCRSTRISSIKSSRTYSLVGLLADEGTKYWQLCFGLPQDPAGLKQKTDPLRFAHRSAYPLGTLAGGFTR